MRLSSVGGGVLVTAILLGCTPGLAQASPILLFSQPLTTVGGPYSQTPDQMVADNFSIAAGGAIDLVTWYGDAYNQLPFGAFTVTFYSDTGSGPSATLASYTIASPTIVTTGLTDSYGHPILQFTAAIPVFNAAPGVSYFFSVVENGPFNFTWAQSNLFGGEWIDIGSGWFDASSDRNGSTAYELYSSNAAAVPEPGTLLTLALGLVGLHVTRRARVRRRAQHRSFE